MCGVGGSHQLPGSLPGAMHLLANAIRSEPRHFRERQVLACHPPISVLWMLWMLSFTSCSNSLAHVAGSASRAMNGLEALDWLVEQETLPDLILLVRVVVTLP